MRLKIWHGAQAVADGPARASDLAEPDLALLYEREAPRLRRRLSRRFTPERAADLVQSAFVRLLRLGSDRLGEIEQPAAYLARTADNLARDEAKGDSRRAHLHSEGVVYDVIGPDLQAALEARDKLRRIEAAIPLLPDRTREIFMAHRFEDLTYPEIARRMGVSVKTVEKHMSRALYALHRAVGSR